MHGVEIVAVDVGGTHARFGIATVADGTISIGETTVFATADHAGLATAWRAFADRAGRPLPAAAAIALACPIEGDVLRMTNNPWVVRPARLARDLDIARLTLVNDFAAVAHAVLADPATLAPLCGPERPLDLAGVVTVVGPGTGLGVAMLVDGRVVAAEGGHIAFAPLDEIDDALVERLRARFGRVSVERVAAGPGLAAIRATLAARAGRTVAPLDDATLWAGALAGTDDLAAAALDRFALNLGAVAGDLALAQGATAVVVAGGLGLRLADYLPRSGFAAAFAAKGRFAARMAGITVKLMTHPQPGLIGAAAAFVREHEA